MLCWEMVCTSHQYVLSFRLRLWCVCAPEIIHISLCCFLLSELFSYYLYLMDLTVEVLLYCLCMSLYSPRPEFLRCDKAQWVNELDGSVSDAASETMRSCWPPQHWIFLTFFIAFVSLYLHYCFRHQRLELGFRQKTKSHGN